MLIVLPERTEPHNSVNKGISSIDLLKNLQAFGLYLDFVKSIGILSQILQMLQECFLR